MFGEVASEDLPLQVKVEADNLVIRIGIDRLAFSFETGEGNQIYNETLGTYRTAWKVINGQQFAEGIAIALQTQEEDGSTPITKILDEAFIKAIEDDMGVEEVKPNATNP